MPRQTQAILEAFSVTGGTLATNATLELDKDTYPVKGHASSIIKIAGTGRDYQDITKIRVYDDGGLRYEVTGAVYKSMVNTWFQRTIIADTDTQFTLHFDLPDRDGPASYQALFKKLSTVTKFQFDVTVDAANAMTLTFTPEQVLSMEDTAQWVRSIREKSFTLNGQNTKEEFLLGSDGQIRSLWIDITNINRLILEHGPFGADGRKDMEKKDLIEYSRRFGGPTASHIYFPMDPDQDGDGLFIATKTDTKLYIYSGAAVTTKVYVEEMSARV